MRISKTTLTILISMLILSIFIANVANLISTEVLNSFTRDTKENDNFIKITNKYDHLIWFLQISDIHISIFRDQSRITEFKEFCHYNIDIIKPAVVLASGDLTDAKTRDSIGSQQFEKEWQYYRNALDENHVQNKTVWLDIRGNHDNFNVAGLNSKQNFFTNYSVQGKKHPRSYMHQIRSGSDIYSFIGIDACLEPGPRRPFNFVGMIDQVEVNELNRLINVTKISKSNYSVWFGHFPTSCILSTGDYDVRSLLGRDQHSMVYLCGHLHQLGGIITKMYTLQQAGFLELELGDWKDNRVYRLLVIDHGMLSFVDLQHREWPVVIITNPKHALFLIPKKESLNSIRESTHIRILAFSISTIESVKFRLNTENWRTCEHVKGPLYVAQWFPKDYETGIHNMEVHVKDIDGREKFLSQPFTLDGTRLSFDILPRIALMSNASTIFKVMFAVMVVISILPLCILRYLHKLVKEKRLQRPKMRKNCVKLWIRKLWILSTVDRIFWPIILYPIYLTIGPWSIGYLVEEHLGVIFAWGIFVNKTFLPGSFTYAYGFIQLLTFQIPLMFILANGVDHRFQYQVLKPGKSRTILGQICLHLPFIILFSIQVLMAYFFWLAYGTLAFLLGPLRTWSIVLAVILWHQALSLPEKCTREAAQIWSRKSESSLNQTNSSLNNATENITYSN